MTLRHSYTLIAPFYDAMVGRATRSARSASLQSLGDVSGQRILLSGVGTGLDIPLLSPAADYWGIDLTPAMLQRARRRADAAGLVIDTRQGDVMALPYAEADFDVVVMHLILAVVPDPDRALAEAARVLRPGGRVLIFDKFLRPGQAAPLRRLLSPLISRIATRTDVEFERVLAATSGLQVMHDIPALSGGWFRRILLQKTG